MWNYHERSRTECTFACLGSIPHTPEFKLIGRPLRGVVIPTQALGSVTIESISREREGWLTVAVTPEWRQF